MQHMLQTKRVQPMHPNQPNEPGLYGAGKRAHDDAAKFVLISGALDAPNMYALPYAPWLLAVAACRGSLPKLRPPLFSLQQEGIHWHLQEG